MPAQIFLDHFGTVYGGMGEIKMDEWQDGQKIMNEWQDGRMAI